MTQYLSYKIKNVNVLMTLLIVMMHCTWADRRFGALLTITDLAVPTFFCISSFLYFRDYDGSKAQYLRKLKSRVMSLLVPFLFYNIVLYGYYLITANFLHLFPSKVIPTNPVDVAVFIFESQADPPLWYLLTLFLFVVIAPIIGWLATHLPMLCGLIILLGGAFSRFGYSGLLYWIPVILLGSLMAIQQNKIMKFVDRCMLPSKPMCLLAFFYLLATCYLFYGIGNSRAHEVSYYYYRMIAPLIIILIYRQLDVIPRKVTERTASLCIFFYGAHFPVKEAITAVLSKASANIPFVAKYLIVLIATLSIVYVAAIALRRINPLWRMLSGGR